MKGLSAAVKVGILVLLMVVAAYVTWKSIGTKLSGDDNYMLWAKFRDASGMPEGSRVVVAGLPVGEIDDLSIDGRFARVEMTIRDDVVVYENAVVYKKSTSLLGDYYLEIDPGTPTSVDAQGNVRQNRVLEDGDQIPRVAEAVTPDQLIAQISESLPNVDAVLLSVRDLSEDVRRLVNGPIASVANRVDDLVQKEADTVSSILARADRSLERIERITADIREITEPADERVASILENLDEASAEARELVVSARQEVEDTGAKVREKLDLVDELLTHSSSIARKIDEDEGTLGRLVNDSEIADNVEDITEDAKGFLGTLFGMKTYVGLRSEYNVFSGISRFYVNVELHTRPDKFYYIELSKGPRGGSPDVTLEFDPTVDRGTFVRKIKIEDKIRFTFQFAKRYRWLTLRYGIKESTGGIGADVDIPLLGRHLKLQTDVFDASFDDLPRVKVAAAYEVFRHIYVLGGVDDVLNNPQTLTLDPGDIDVPGTFDELRYGRDYFVGAMLRFNDQDLAALLAVGGAAVAGLAQ